jgi:hypothetical protein
MDNITKYGLRVGWNRAKLGLSLKDWPLALCDLATLDENDMVALDEVHKDDVLEGFQLCYRPSQRWYYLKVIFEA